MKRWLIAALAVPAIAGLLFLLTSRNLDRAHHSAAWSKAENVATGGQTQVEANLTSTSQSARDTAYFRKESWVFAGHASPEAALERIHWALRQENINAFLSSLTQDAKAEFSQGYEGKTETQMKEELHESMLKVKGYRITDRTMVSQDRVRLTFTTEGEARPNAKLFRLVDNEWKLDVDQKPRRRR